MPNPYRKLAFGAERQRSPRANREQLRLEHSESSTTEELAGIFVGANSTHCGFRSVHHFRFDGSV
jgi:hypothetical protein